MKTGFLIFLFFCIGNVNAQEKAKQLIPFRIGNLWGYANNNHKIIITPKFSQAAVFGYATNCCYYSDFAKVKLGSKYYLIDMKGKLIDESKILKHDSNEGVPPQEDQNDNTDSLDVDGSVINNGQLIIPSTFYQLIEFRKGYNSYFIATKNDKKGIIDRDDHIVLPFKYDDAEYIELKEYYDTLTNKMITPNYFLLKEKGSTFYFFGDKNGERVSKINVLKAKALTNFIAFQQQNNEGVPLWGLMNRNFDVLVKPIYKEILKEEDFDIFLVMPFDKKFKDSNGLGYINEKGVEFFK